MRAFSHERGATGSSDSVCGSLFFCIVSIITCFALLLIANDAKAQNLSNLACYGKEVRIEYDNKSLKIPTTTPFRVLGITKCESLLSNVSGVIFSFSDGSWKSIGHQIDGPAPDTLRVFKVPNPGRLDVFDIYKSTYQSSMQADNVQRIDESASRVSGGAIFLITSSKSPMGEPIFADCTGPISSAYRCRVPYLQNKYIGVELNFLVKVADVPDRRFGIKGFSQFNEMNAAVQLFIKELSL